MSLHPSRRFYRRIPHTKEFVDLFAGGGGTGGAIKKATGRSSTVAINHSPIAMAVHAANHPETRHIISDVFSKKADPRIVVGDNMVSDLWASPDCTDHSNAKGGKPIEKDTRVLAWVVLDWVRETMPERVFIENVPEFPQWGPLIRARITKGKNKGKLMWRRDPARRGETFQSFIGQLELLGYKVEWRNLVACDYGAPTKRKRMFLVARRDGLPIVWPLPTHGTGPGLIPYRTAAECIDWSIPGRSIFGRKKPLAEKTMWRIAQGLKRFIFENPKPYIVTIDNQSSARTDSTIDEPLSTVVTKARHVVVAPSLVKVNHGKREARGESIEEPLSTVTASRRGHALIAATLQHSGNGERTGQAARVYDIEQPIGTVMATGQKHALIAAYLATYFGDPKRKKGGGVVVGQALDQPLGTVTARDHHGLAAVTLANYRGTGLDQPGAHSVDEPLNTISGGGIHTGLVRAFLTAYYTDDHGPGNGQDMRDPMRTITTKARLGLVTVHGVDYQIVDITLRMLLPHELLKAQFGDYAEGYDLSAAKTQAAKVMMIGNSVSPPPAIALLIANGAGRVSDHPGRKAA